MENEKEWESRKTPTKLQFCSDLWGKHWLLWQLRGLPAVSFAVSDLQIRKGICGSDLTQSFQPWRLPLPHHQYHLWYLLQVTNLVRAWSQQEIDKHKKNMGKAVPTWNYLIHRRIWLTLMKHERENSTAYGLLPDDGSLKESKPVHQKQTLALTQQPTANTTCWMFPRPRKQDALRRFCSMKNICILWMLRSRRKENPQSTLACQHLWADASVEMQTRFVPVYFAAWGVTHACGYLVTIAAWTARKWEHKMTLWTYSGWHLQIVATRWWWQAGTNTNIK